MAHSSEITVHGIHSLHQVIHMIKAIYNLTNVRINVFLFAQNIYLENDLAVFFLSLYPSVSVFLFLLCSFHGFCVPLCTYYILDCSLAGADRFEFSISSWNREYKHFYCFVWFIF